MNRFGPHSIFLLGLWVSVGVAGCHKAPPGPLGMDKSIHPALRLEEPKYVVTDPKQVAALNEAWERRTEFPLLDELDYHIPLYARFLEGMKICLDPGHGGDAHLKRYKRGPTDAREAEMNWNTALHLRDFLEQAGAQVRLTRDGDADVGLRERVRIANRWGADLFISLHHNAAGPLANRTTTWYHAHPDHMPSSLDLARYLQVGVADALRLPQVDEMPLKSDYLMFEGSGFGVLRGLEMPGCLGEASFFTNPYEEYRLQQDWYLKRLAYGYFLGLSRYVWMGIPKGRMIHPNPGSAIDDKRPRIEVRADSGYSKRRSWAAERPWIFTDSVSLRLNGRPIPFAFDRDKGVIAAQIAEPLAAGRHVVEAGFRNHQGNYSHPVRNVFVVDPPMAELRISVASTETTGAPTDSDLPATLTLTAFDADGEPVMDGSQFILDSEEIEFSETVLKTVGGEALTLIRGGVAQELDADKPITLVVTGKFGSAPMALYPPFTTPFLWKK